MSQLSPDLTLHAEMPADEPVPGIVSDLMQLTKARLSLLVVITTFVGFCMGSGPRIDWPLLAHAVIGTMVAAAAAAVLNQWMETNVDRLMERTRHRPLPAGRMRRPAALGLGLALAVGGIGHLWLAVNGLSAALAAATVLIYLALYTPLKRLTSLCTLAGAVSGALPPMIGWASARASLDLGAWVLFGILFTWQMPHFLAIAWMYRDEYAQAGFIMMRRDDHAGSATALESMIYTLALALISVIPFAAGMNSSLYLGGALMLNAGMFLCAGNFLAQRDRPSARLLFFASILFLPLLLGLMVATKLS